MSLVYFRAAYTPKDYHSDKEWDARRVIEKSWAVKCPSIPYQLVGMKKVQQVLAEPGRLESYFSQPDEIESLRSIFAELYPLDRTPHGQKAFQAALDDPEKYVLKPQREGGGNNIYGQAIKVALSTMSEEERSAYILMERLCPPVQQNYLVTNGLLNQDFVTNELGIYGVWVSDGQVTHINSSAGVLLRTKVSSVLEGGIAIGTGVLDTPFLD